MMKIEQIHALLQLMDLESTVTGKLDRLKQWFKRFPEISDFRVILFSVDDAEISSEILHHYRISDHSLFPREPVLLNGRSAIPKEIFPKELRKEVTLYYPFGRMDGGPYGALLIKCTKPKVFLRRYREELGIIASKAGDVLKIGSLKRKFWEFRNSETVNETVSPDMMGKLMDYLDLPMYITNRKGEFVSVNGRFLEEFTYSNVEEVNKAGHFFLDSDNWSKGIRRLIGTDGTSGIMMKVRGGRGETKVVKDAATLVGKYTMGVLFDISPYINWNEKLQETVDELRSLNEKLTATTSILQKTQSTAMKSLAKLAEYRDMETGNHLHRICEFNRLMTRKVHEQQPYFFHIGEDYVQDIYLSGMLHDIGKVGVPDQILLKDGGLTESEWEVMKKHTLWGWDILREADHELGEQSFLTLASRIALSHHEHFDGNGYPKKLRAEDIPLSARISAISDVYDALTSKRPYKDAWPHDRAAEEIIRQTGEQFDPVLVDIFENIETEFQKVKLALPDNSMVN
jgi:hypothetical protein